jgi:DEAD/DEAH box helicase domain-containing protein
MILMCEVGDLQHAVAAGTPGPEGIAAFAPVGLGRPSAEASLLASGRPTIYLYDDLPGGAGLATRAHSLGRGFFEHVLAVVRGCGCKYGCPTCIGTEVALAPGSSPRIIDPSGIVAEANADPDQLARRHARADLVATLDMSRNARKPCDADLA